MGDNIKMDLREIMWQGVDCIHLSLDKEKWQVPVYMVINLWVL
jgi:hypothetical protein